jgi:hypothetical protein
MTDNFCRDSKAQPREKSPAGYGFAAIALTSTLIPLVTLLLVAPLRSIAPPPHTQTALPSPG